jgi:hypothetical protein
VVVTTLAYAAEPVSLSAKVSQNWDTATAISASQ